MVCFAAPRPFVWMCRDRLTDGNDVQRSYAPDYLGFVVLAVAYTLVGLPKILPPIRD